MVQTSFVPKTRSAGDFLPAAASYKGKEYRVAREPTAAEYDDLLFGWLVETGITSNSVIYVKDGATVGIGTGEQDRVGVAEIARDKAYRKLADRLCWETFKTPYASLAKPEARAEIDREVARMKGGIAGSVMISDGFFPFRDGVDVGLREGVTAIAQPGRVRPGLRVDRGGERGGSRDGVHGPALLQALGQGEGRCSSTCRSRN